jgi:hypothetical protein
MRESTLRKLAETRYAVTLEPDEVAEVRDTLRRYLVYIRCKKSNTSDFQCSLEEGHEGMCCQWKLNATVMPPVEVFFVHPKGNAG